MEPLEPAYTFPYLVLTTVYNNSHCEDMHHNLRKDWRCWGVIFKVSTKRGAMVWAHGMLYKAVAQTVLLYGSESWVMKGAILKVLEKFYHITRS